eukprot:gene8400-17317_t
MGKSGKLRKQRILMQTISAASTNDLDQCIHTDDCLNDEELSSTISTLDALGENLDLFHAYSMKAFRSILYPLVEEQKGKHFERRIHVGTESTISSISLEKSSILIAMHTLVYLSKHLDIFHSKELKHLRASLHPLLEEQLKKKGLKEISSDASISYTSKISTLLSTSKWTDVLLELDNMRHANQSPKLGALQRWIRDADLAPPDLRYPLIDAILRVVEFNAKKSNIHILNGHKTKNYIQNPSIENEGVITRNPLPKAYPEFDPRQHLNPSVVRNTEGASSAFPSSKLMSTFTPSKIIVVHTISGCDRRPPSETDLHMYSLVPGTLLLPPNKPDVTHALVPGVPGARIILDALTHNECDEWLRIAHTMGYSPDAVSGINHILWLADDLLISQLFDRVKPHLPPTMTGSGELMGLNSRLRLFRYEAGAVFRIHIDGAWPGAGLNTEGKYVDDIFGDRYSRLTFLIYLTDDFDGGHTTFYIPDPNQVGQLEARAVRPLKGSILCFPHGDAIGSLAHEGSAVSQGVKYVVRTDVLYALPVVEKRNHTATATATEGNGRHVGMKRARD